MAYWLLSIALIVFGWLTGFSIGQPFLFVGLAMLLLGAFRRRPAVYWPPMLAVIAYDVTYWFITPLGCTTTVTASGVGRTVCSNLLGLSYQGEGLYNPSRGPAVVAGLVMAAIVFVVTMVALVWLQRRDAVSAA